MMQRLSELYRRIRLLSRGRAVDAEMDAEMQFHLELETAKLERAGHGPAEARRRAALAFGARDRFREESRDARGFGQAEQLLRETRHSVRRLAKELSFTVPAVVTLALGIGATAAVLTLVDGVLLSPLPYPAADRLVVVGHDVGTRGTAGGVSAGLLEHYRSGSSTLERLGPVLENRVALTDGDAAERVLVAMLSPEVLSLMAPRAAVGRLFVEADVEERAIIISHRLWQRRYGGDPAIIGGTIEANRLPRPVVGVMPPRFDFPDADTDVWYATSASENAGTAGIHDLYLTGIGRLRPGATAADAQRELGALLQRVPERFTEVTAADLRAAQLTPTVRTLKDARVAEVRGPLLVLLMLVALVLVIAWANALNLVLLRAERQRREVAVARALGAGAGTIARRAFVEHSVLALVAVAAAFGLAALAVSLRFGFAPGQIARLHEVAVTGRLAATCALLGAATLLLLGAVSFARMNAPGAETLRLSFTRLTLSRATLRAQRALVGAQVAFALVLLVCCGAMVQGLLRMQRIDTGFKAADVLMFDLNPPARQYLSYGSASALHARIRNGLAAVPGVSAVEAAAALPLQPTVQQLRTQLATDDPAAAAVAADVNLVTPGYFDALHIPVVAGRTFIAADAAAEEPGVIISRALAHQLFGRDAAVGQRVRLEGAAPLRVVGVAGDVVGSRITSDATLLLYMPAIFDEAMPAEFRPQLTYVPREMTVLVHTTLPPATIASALRGVMADVDAQIPVTAVTPVERLLHAATARARLITMLLAIAALATLFLGATGLWGVVAYSMSRRAPELAIRMAVGAQPSAVVSMLMRQGVTVAVIGAIAGIGAAFAVMRVLTSLMHEPVPPGPAMAAVATALLLGIACIACWLPARRAVRIDPARLLRAE